MAITPAESAQKIFDESLMSLMAHTLRGVTNHFVKRAIDIDIRVVADTCDTIRLRGPNQGATSILVTRFRRRNNPLEWDRVRATIFIHKDANKNLARFCIAHEVFHLLLELDSYLNNGRTAWGRLPTSRAIEDECDHFARQLCKLHDDFNRNERHREKLILFPTNAFETVLKTHDTANQLSWPKGIELDPKNPFHVKPRLD